MAELRPLAHGRTGGPKAEVDRKVRSEAQAISWTGSRLVSKLVLLAGPVQPSRLALAVGKATAVHQCSNSIVWCPG